MRRRVVKRKIRAAGSSTGQPAATVPMTAASFGLKDGAECQILIIGSSNYCSFTIARLGRLGISENIGITASASHAIWAATNLAPKIVIASIDQDGRSKGIELMRKIEILRPGIAVILTSSALDVNLDQRVLRDFAWDMSDSWSFVTRRKTDNGDPLGIAVVTAGQGVGWIDFPVRKQIEEWRVAAPNRSKAVPVAA